MTATPTNRRTSNRTAGSFSLTRRSWLKTGATLAGVTALGGLRAVAAAAPVPVEPDFRIRHGRIKQSITGWAFPLVPPPELARPGEVAGPAAMEGIDAKLYLRVCGGSSSNAMRKHEIARDEQYGWG